MRLRRTPVLRYRDVAGKHGCAVGPDDHQECRMGRAPKGVQVVAMDDADGIGHDMVGKLHAMAPGKEIRTQPKVALRDPRIAPADEAAGLFLDVTFRKRREFGPIAAKVAEHECDANAAIPCHREGLRAGVESTRRLRARLRGTDFENRGNVNGS
jgi:hypothetical protein